MIRILMSVAFATIVAVAPLGGAAAAPAVSVAQFGTGGEGLSAVCGAANRPGFLRCLSLRTGDCGLAKGADQLFCQALLGRHCELASGRDYWFCLSVTSNRSCGLNATSGDFWLSEAINQRNCGLAAPGSEAWLCPILIDALAASEPGLAEPPPVEPFVL